MKRVNLLVILCCVSSALIAMEEKEYTNLQDLVPHYADITKKIFEQPVQRKSESVPKKIRQYVKDGERLLTWNDGDAQICELLGTQMIGDLKLQQKWSLYTIFHHMELKIYDIYTSEWVKEGIGLRTTSQEITLNEPLTIDVIEKSYEDIVKTIQLGWSLATVEQHPNVFFQENSDWLLFVKTKVIKEEDLLIRCLYNKFKLEESVSCYDKWLVDDKLQTLDSIYLFIKKDSLEKFQSIFGFELDKQSNT